MIDLILNQSTAGQIVDSTVAMIKQSGITPFEFYRVSKKLRERSNGSFNGKVIINVLAAFDFRLHLIGERLMSFPIDDCPSIVIPETFSDTTMQFSRLMEFCHAGDTFEVYFPTADELSGLKHILIKQGVWLRNSNGRYLHALLYRDCMTVDQFADDTKFGGRTTIFVPIIRLDQKGLRVSLLRSNASILKAICGPFARLKAIKSNLFEIRHLDSLPESAGDFETLRKVCTDFAPAYTPILNYFDSRTNELTHEMATGIMELLIATQSVQGDEVRNLLMSVWNHWNT